MAHAVQKVVERCEVAKENGGIMGKKLFIHKLFSLDTTFIVVNNLSRDRLKHIF